MHTRKAGLCSYSLYAWTLGAWILGIWTLELWSLGLKKIKLDLTKVQSLIMLSLIAGFKFSKFLLESGRQWDTMFLERRTSVKMGLVCLT